MIKLNFVVNKFSNKRKRIFIEYYRKTTNKRIKLNNQKNISNLPQELIEIIIEYLKYLKDIRNLVSSCSDFYYMFKNPQNIQIPTRILKLCVMSRRKLNENEKKGMECFFKKKNKMWSNILFNWLDTNNEIDIEFLKNIIKFIFYLNLKCIKNQTVLLKSILYHYFWHILEEAVCFDDLESVNYIKTINKEFKKWEYSSNISSKIVKRASLKMMRILSLDWMPFYDANNRSILYFACWLKETEKALEILTWEKTKKFNLNDELSIASQNGLTTVIKTLLKMNNKINPGFNNSFSLTLACSYNNNMVVKLLLDDGRININENINSPELNPLCIAFANNNSDLIILLLKQPNIKIHRSLRNDLIDKFNQTKALIFKNSINKIIVDYFFLKKKYIKHPQKF